ncbi:hypothetical protein LuPra_04713 [Luteitalea pratensis]|uniref:Uncharacterized protein n=1 Tax=Luteitalea pratensis TaxID=1855912 RepID=A0A143PTH4_LUTPR|nr:hypothetical protein [Luteitalea pratensis]AMY11463.1 hypothetical protein LuPra_04713 [Luteitalea pratensis]
MSFPGTITARVTPAGTGALSAWGTSAVTGPIIVQRAIWGMEPSVVATESVDTADAKPAGGNRAPTRAA